MTAAYSADEIRTARSFLFVPGNRPERFAKAAAAQPDIVLIDLEDAVTPAEKDAARRNVRQWHAAGNAAMVRINSAETTWYKDDLELITELAVPTMVAKAESAAEIGRIARLAAGLAVVPLIETATGVLALAEICAVDGVQRLAFGNIDLANQLGVDPDDRDALLLSRSAMVLQSAAAALAPPIDGVTTVFTEPQAVTDDFAHARRLGLSAKLCIHPAQVAVVHAAAAPSAEAVHWAQKIIAAAGADDSAAAVDGQMVDIPVVERARRILAAANRS